MDVTADDQHEQGWSAQIPTMLWCSLDMEFQYFVVRERLSKQLSEVRQGLPVPTSALRDGTARRRREQRIAQRVQKCTRGITEHSNEEGK
ncbi:hypothetical protein ACTXG6_39590 [Pseudonocardia sp. Cha107L01]|uniref:hypothetical protein n=1 Tax=Pseudonocardia sp. Cha107L01 TaxID=3457576 RepID=UPI00403E8E10